MSQPENSGFPRRAFLRGAAGVVGATVVGLKPTESIASALQESRIQKPLSFGYFDGVSIVSADKLPKGDASLQHVIAVMRGYGPYADIHGIEQMALVKTSGGVKQMPFQAFVAPPKGCEQVRFRLPVDAQKGLLFSVQQPGGATLLELTPGNSANPKLRQGTYILVAGNVNWNAFHFDPKQPNHPLLTAAGAPASMQYVVIYIEQAG